MVSLIQDYLVKQSKEDRATETLRRAEGVIVGLRRCSLESATSELTQVAHRYRLDAYRIARALVGLAQEVDPEVDSNATAIARFEWGALLPLRGSSGASLVRAD